MPTDKLEACALFLFAHQDDEFGVFTVIEDEVRKGRRVVCVYVTDGGATADPLVRNKESLAVLERLGVGSGDVLFAGGTLAIRDGCLLERPQQVAAWLREFLEANPGVVACYVPAWEGGHPDHDVLHAVAITVFDQMGMLALVRQYSLYNRRYCIGPFFAVLSPMPENGSVERVQIPWAARLKYIGLCLGYPSQWRSWVGLFGFVLVHYVFRGDQSLQSVLASRLMERPHGGILYYEKRGFSEWKAVMASVKTLTGLDRTNPVR